jgi:hypothetical protein
MILTFRIQFWFRPGRSAHQALKQAKAHMAKGKCWVVDMDLEKFFDEVHHDILMSRIAGKVEEERAWKSASNGRGPWWNSGASHMKGAFPKKFFDRIGSYRCWIQL